MKSRLAVAAACLILFTNASLAVASGSKEAGSGKAPHEPTGAATKLASAPALASAHVAGDTTAAVSPELPDLHGRVIRAVTADNYAPLNFVDPDSGKPGGWEYDALDEIARRLDAKVKWSVVSWDNMIPAVRSGQFDIGADGVAITAERKKQVDFSDPYMVSRQCMLARKGDSRFSTADQFSGNRKLLIGSKANTTSFYTAVYEILDGDPRNPRIKLFDSFGAAMQALMAGDIDLVPMDGASADRYVAAHPDTLKIVGSPLGSEDFGFIFTPKSDLVGPVNMAIASVKQDGFFDRLNTKWFFEYGMEK